MRPPCRVVKLTWRSDLVVLEWDGSTHTFKVICPQLCESLKAPRDTEQHVGRSRTFQLLLLISLLTAGPSPLVVTFLSDMSYRAAFQGVAAHVEEVLQNLCLHVKKCLQPSLGKRYPSAKLCPMILLLYMITWNKIIRFNKKLLTLLSKIVIGCTHRNKWKLCFTVPSIHKSM